MNAGHWGLQIGIVAAKGTVALVPAIVAVGNAVAQLIAGQAVVVALELVL